MHVAPWGVFVTTPVVARESALVDVGVTAENLTAARAEVQVGVLGDDFANPGDLAEVTHCLGDEACGGALEEHTGLAFHDRVEEPSEARRRRGLPQRGHFERRQAKVLVRRSEQRLAVCVAPTELVVPEPAEKRDPGPRQRLEPRPFELHNETSASTVMEENVFASSGSAARC